MLSIHSRGTLIVILGNLEILGRTCPLEVARLFTLICVCVCVCVQQELSALIPKSAVGTLSTNPSSIVQLIIDAYNVSTSYLYNVCM